MPVSSEQPGQRPPNQCKHFFGSMLLHQEHVVRWLKGEYPACEIEIPTNTPRFPAKQIQNSRNIRTEDPNLLTCLNRITAKILHRLSILENDLSGVCLAPLLAKAYSRKVLLLSLGANVLGVVVRVSF